MRFEFVSRRDFNIIDELAKKLGCRADNDILRLPGKVGEGYIRLIDIGPKMRLVIHRHKLKEKLIFKRHSSPVKNGIITITFNILDRPRVFIQDGAGQGISLSSVYMLSSDIGIETCFPAGKDIYSTILITHSDMIRDLLESHADNPLISRIISGQHSFWHDTRMTAEIRDVLMQLDDTDNSKPLNNLLFRIKAQQLIYSLFVRMLEAENRPNHSFKEADIEKMYFIKEIILSDLTVAPRLNLLSRKAGMSETKMKLLFKQIFGKSIYNYYQVVRMEEAVQLLKKLSVSETGYKLGFTNLSYFSRLFEKHHKLPPGKFKLSISYRD